MSQKRNLLIKCISDIKEGRTFYRSQLPHTMENKLIWDELKAEIKYGFNIDIPMTNLSQSHKIKRSIPN